MGRTDRTRLSDLRRAVSALYRDNRQQGYAAWRSTAYDFVCPSVDTYPYQWFWDSCFHAIALAHFEPDSAKAELRSLLTGQFNNGMFPHMIYRGENELMKLGDGFVRIEWGKEKTSTITQPPMLAEALWKIYEKDGDREFLRLMYPHVKDFHAYLLSARDPRGNHLAGIINPDESGEDNSPRFDSVLGLPPVQTLQENFLYFIYPIIS